MIWRLSTAPPLSSFLLKRSRRSALPLQFPAPNSKCSVAQATTQDRTVRRTLVDNSMAVPARLLSTTHPHSSTLHPCSNLSSHTALHPRNLEASRKGISSSLCMDNRNPEVLLCPADRRCLILSSLRNSRRRPYSSHYNSSNIVHQAPARRLLSLRVASPRRLGSTQTMGVVYCSMVCLRFLSFCSVR